MYAPAPTPTFGGGSSILVGGSVDTSAEQLRQQRATPADASSSVSAVSEKKQQQRHPTVGELPLMQLYDPFFVSSTPMHYPLGGRAAASAPPAAAAASDPLLRFTVTVASISFEAGSLEPVEGTISLVDIGSNRRRLSAGPYTSHLFQLNCKSLVAACRSLSQVIPEPTEGIQPHNSKMVSE